jgi:hypothetical protein
MATIKKISKAKNLSAGPSKKTPVAGPVDPKGKWTGIQKRTLGNMKKGGKIKKAPIGALLPLAAKALPMIGKALGGGAGKGMLGKMGGNMLGGLIGGGNDKEESMKKGGKITKAKGGKWIQKAIKKPGALRAQLGAKPGKPIPAGKLAAAAKKPGKIGQRARLAQTLKKMKK